MPRESGTPDIIRTPRPLCCNVCGKAPSGGTVLHPVFACGEHREPRSVSERSGPSDTEILNYIDELWSCVRGTDVRKWTIEAADETQRDIRSVVCAALEARRDA
jgi:hypothetical protein